MKFKPAMLALLSFLGIAKEQAADTDVTEEQLDLINTGMAKLRSDIASRDQEIASLKSSGETALQAKDAEIARLTSENSSLKDQVENLRKNPTETPAVAPANEPLAEDASPLDQLAAFADENGDFLSIVSKGQQLGVL